MAQTKLGETIVNLSGSLPAVGSNAPDFKLVKTDLSEVSLNDFLGNNIVLNIFPSIDTRVCAISVREFNRRATEMPNTVVLCIAKDLPYAFKRFCAAEGLDKVVPLSDYRNKGFSKHYGIEMLDGKMEGLHARAVVVINPDGKVKYTELVPVIGQEPDYESAIKSLKKT